MTKQNVVPDIFLWEKLFHQDRYHPTQRIVFMLWEELVLKIFILPFNAIVCIYSDLH